MTTKSLMSVEEYLNTSFEGPDCDYLDGEVVERNMGELPHAEAQGQLIYLLRDKRWQFRVLPEIRIQITSNRFRVADVAVWRAGADLGDRVPVIPPFLVIEILSHEDRMIRMQMRIQEYLSIGVEWVWMIDPEEKQAIVFSQKHPGGVLSGVLRTENPAIELPIECVFQPEQ